MAKQTVLIGKKYKYTSDMIKAAVTSGFTHMAGGSLACRKCGCKSSVRKFLKDKNVLYACNKCGARWGNFIK
jgi:hypothetical protein